MRDLFTHLAKSYLQIEGRLTEVDGSAYANVDAVALANNGLMHLFSQMTYSLSNQEVGAVYHPGQATTMFGILKYPNDFTRSRGLNRLWSKDTTATAIIADNTGFAVRHSYLIQKPTAKGTFSFIVPLKYIFGFCDDYDKIVYGLEHMLTLVRKTDADALFRAHDAAGREVNISKISWFMPHIVPVDIEKMNLYKTIESKATLPVVFRARQCYTITVPRSTTFSWRLSVKTSPEKTEMHFGSISN